ncbi:hypothetical protein ACQ4M3_08030 [Leptolyngbya sp. AN03gr2]|uniref:hypothetical protein n=1 Tax=unclassified Leptolyngbya TaxID=2650499 RepID=UPI003D30F773
MGLLFEIPFPQNSERTASFRLSHFKIAANAHTFHSKHAHPLEANFVSGSGICGCFIPMKEFCQTATITGYYPHHSNDQREEQYQIQAQYEKEHGLPPIAEECLQAIAWEGWFSLDELRYGLLATPAVPIKEAKRQLIERGATYIQARGQFIKIDEWQPYGAEKKLFLYEVNGDCIIEHLNPQSRLANSGIQAGAWSWSKTERWNRRPQAKRLQIRREADRWGYETRTFFLDGIKIGEWTCLRSIQEQLGGQWKGNELCQDLGLSDRCGGYSFDCQSQLVRDIAPYKIFSPHEENPNQKG